jgi:hypothetical protein
VLFFRSGSLQKTPPKTAAGSNDVCRTKERVTVLVPSFKGQVLPITLTGTPFLVRPVEHLIRHIAREHSDRHRTSNRYRLAQRLDTLNLVHGLSREIRLAAMRA